MKGILETAPEDEEASSFWRRMYALSVFALFDGVIYRMTLYAYAARHRRDVAFSLSELSRLEKAFDFDRDEELVSSFSKTQMLDDIRFAFNVFARVHYSDYVLPTHEPGWMDVEEILRIREVLQYPKEAQQLEVDHGKVTSLVEGLRWFVERMVDLIESSEKHTLDRFAAWEDEEEGSIM
jgi:hypothetical protein